MSESEQYLQEFVDEAAGHVETVESILVDSAGVREPDRINEVFRAVHSVKGMAGFFGLTHIVDLAHAMENVFDAVRSDRLQVNDDMIDWLLAANDCLKGMIGNVGESENVDIAPHLQKLQSLLGGQSAKTAAPPAKAAAAKGGAKAPAAAASAESAAGTRYRIRLRFLHDLQGYPDGVDGLLRAVKKAGQLRITQADHSQIASFDDVLAAMDGAAKDVLLTAEMTSPLDLPGLAKALQVAPAAITAVKSGKSASAAPKAAGSAAAGYKPAAGGGHSAIRVDDTIRVNVQLLNDLMDMASEMVLGRNQLLRKLSDRRDSIPGLAPILQNVDRLTSGLQEKIMQTRMQPVANVFNKFPRIIRDMSRELHKEIQLRIEGADVELDKSMIEAIGDPVTHLVRNSADHGLESPEVREKAGKDRVGVITLRAYHEGGFVHVEVIDDGAGLNVEKIRRKALETGIVTREELAEMSEHEVCNLIFRPGFSTADKITDISGRGVGMDVVKTNIGRIGGSIEVHSVAGKGTTIRLVLPLTLAIIQSLIVEVGGHLFAMPQVNIREIVQARSDSAQRIEHIHGADVIRLRGRLIPLVYLTDVLHMSDTPDKGVGDSPVVILIRVGAVTFGVAVRAIVESEETLAKPLPRSLKSCLCYSGVTILGDGKTAMILDPEGIVKAAKLSAGAEQEEAAGETAEEEVGAEQQNLLLFQCTGEETYALDMSMIARVEEISPEHIERVGKMEFLKYQQDALRVIHPEDFLPVGRRDAKDSKWYVIVPKLVSHPIGILATRILDNVQTVIHLDTENVKTPGVLGSTVCNGRLLLLLQLYELFSLADPVHYPKEVKKENRRLHVLVADDTVFFQKTIKGYLEQAGYEVETVSDGRAAWESLNKGKYDMVVSDINMPVMDGLELVRRIREKPTLRELPVIALTSLTGREDEKRGRESGFDAYEYKLDRDHLLRTMAETFQKRYGGESVC